MFNIFTRRDNKKRQFVISVKTSNINVKNKIRTRHGLRVGALGEGHSQKEGKK
jgi:hypothetical protein